MKDNNQRKNLFDRWSETYNQDVNHESFPLTGYDQALNAIIELADFHPDHTVLDLGVGTGNLAQRLPLPGDQIWGVDFSEKMLAKAKEAIPGAHLYQVDLRDQNWPPEMQQPFDRIISGYTLHEFSDSLKQEILIRLAADSLAVGGKIVIGDISFLDKAHFSTVYHEFKETWDEEEYYWCAKPMTEALEALGFSVQYQQITFCAGIYVIVYNAPSPGDHTQ